jgi:hypothetical protein
MKHCIKLSEIVFLWELVTIGRLTRLVCGGGNFIFKTFIYFQNRFDVTICRPVGFVILFGCGRSSQNDEPSYDSPEELSHRHDVYSSIAESYEGRNVWYGSNQGALDITISAISVNIAKPSPSSSKRKRLPRCHTLSLWPPALSWDTDPDVRLW